MQYADNTWPDKVQRIVWVNLVKSGQWASGGRGARGGRLLQITQLLNDSLATLGVGGKKPPGNIKF